MQLERLLLHSKLFIAIQTVSQLLLDLVSVTFFFSQFFCQLVILLLSFEKGAL